MLRTIAPVVCIVSAKTNNPIHFTSATQHNRFGFEPRALWFYSFFFPFFRCMSKKRKKFVRMIRKIKLCARMFQQRRRRKKRQRRNKNKLLNMSKSMKETWRWGAFASKKNPPHTPHTYNPEWNKMNEKELHQWVTWH